MGAGLKVLSSNPQGQRPKHQWGLISVFLTCVFVFFYRACKPDWQMARLERNARKVITPGELQAWATNLLNNPPTNSRLMVADLGTNFPAQLLKLFQHPPYISIQHSNEMQPASIFLMWGGGVIGHSGFEIGPPDFVSYRPKSRAWQPGVYFWTDRGP
jgi:hypothetical protein